MSIPSPHITTHELGEVVPSVQFHPCSMIHDASHPSLSITLPSSHVSVWPVPIPSPQIGTVQTDNAFSLLLHVEPDSISQNSFHPSKLT